MWTYTANPAVSEKDQVRFLLQDTDENRQLMQDEEINWLLDQFANPLYAAAEGASVIAARFAALPDRRIGGMSITYSTNAQYYREVAKSLRHRAQRVSPGYPYAGGVTQTDRDNWLQDSELVPPYIILGVHDGPFVTEGFWGTAWGHH
jgi:hypothetical protein